MLLVYSASTPFELPFLLLKVILPDLSTAAKMTTEQHKKHHDAEPSDGKVFVDLAKGDLAAQYLANGEAGQPIDPAVERGLVRKIDMRIVPFICVTYLLTIMDKAMLGYAAVFNLKEDIGLVRDQYSWIASIIYFGYLLVSGSFWRLRFPVDKADWCLVVQFEYPTTYAMQKTSVSKWLSANVFLWGGVTMALGGGRNFADFMGLRFALGALEACSTPAFLLLTAMWYTREEQPIRIGWWSTFLGLAFAFGGLFAFAIGHIEGALAPWRYQFIVIGAISSAWGIFAYFFLAENAMDA